MPIYRYQAAGKGCPYCRDGFEVFLPRQQEVKTCPRCSGPIKKVFLPFSLGFSRSGFDARAKEKGFHKLKRVDKGKYEKLY